MYMWFFALPTLVWECARRNWNGSVYAKWKIARDFKTYIQNYSRSTSTHTHKYTRLQINTFKKQYNFIAYEFNIYIYIHTNTCIYTIYMQDESSQNLFYIHKVSITSIFIIRTNDVLYCVNLVSQHYKHSPVCTSSLYTHLKR